MRQDELIQSAAKLLDYYGRIGSKHWEDVREWRQNYADYMVMGVESPEESGPVPLSEWQQQQADLATLRTQLAAMTAERDAALAKVAVLRDALQEIEWSNESKWQADCARNALEKRK